MFNSNFIVIEQNIKKFSFYQDLLKISFRDKDLFLSLGYPGFKNLGLPSKQSHLLTLKRKPLRM